MDGNNNNTAKTTASTSHYNKRKFENDANE